MIRCTRVYPRSILSVLLTLGALGPCTLIAKENTAMRSYGEDVALLREHVEVIELASDDGRAKLAIVPAYQGRVMTSTAHGNEGVGCGFINDEAVIAGAQSAPINVFGGEDRFWLGPEGGQHAIFFRPGDPFELDHWQTPPLIDTASYTVVAQSNEHVEFAHQASVNNYRGFRYKVSIGRTIRILDRRQVQSKLTVPLADDVAVVAYESDNTLTNAGDQSWTKENGLLSIWILGMFKHSPTCTVAIPFRTGPEEELGPIVNDDYFGEVPADRLEIDHERGVIFFRADGQYRSKIGVSPHRAKNMAGSYNPALNLLTLVQFTLPEGATDYVNSMWEHQEHPYRGDVVNSYNDGPPTPGEKPLGPFYELESSSPAAALGPGESMRHVHCTMHLVGPAGSLDPVSQALLGVPVREIASVLGE